jgi:hypothetical protein
MENKGGEIMRMTKGQELVQIPTKEQALKAFKTMTLFGNFKREVYDYLDSCAQANVKAEPHRILINNYGLEHSHALFMAQCWKEDRHAKS